MYHFFSQIEFKMRCLFAPNNQFRYSHGDVFGSPLPQRNLFQFPAYTVRHTIIELLLQELAYFAGELLWM